jgi:hypothetical protein
MARTTGAGGSAVAAGIVLALSVGLAACTGSPSPPSSSGTSVRAPATAGTALDVHWERLSPVPGALALHWITSAGGQVLVSGERPGAAGPGLWRGDGHGGWRPVHLAPVTYYGRRAELFRVASDGRRVVALGRRIGGTHGNPRVTSWTGTPAGLHETEQRFELFGGPDAIAVTDVAMTRAGALALGAWSHHGDPSGVTVWRQQGDTWERYDRAPGLLSEVTDVGSDLTTPAAVTTRAGEPVLVGWTVHLGGGEIGLRASLWQEVADGDVTAWQEVRLSGEGDAQARAISCDDASCTVAGSVAGRLAVWVVRGQTVRPLAVPNLPVVDQQPVSATATSQGVWLTVGAGARTQVVLVRRDQDRVLAVTPPPGLVTATTEVGDVVVALVRTPDGSTSVWRMSGAGT